MQAKHLPAHADLLKQLDQSLGQTLGQFNQAVPIFDMNATDLTGLQAGFIGNCAHQIAGLDTMLRADFDTKGLELA